MPTRNGRPCLARKRRKRGRNRRARAGAQAAPGRFAEHATPFGCLRRNLMNALQIIPSKPATGIARCRLFYSVSSLILLALVGGISMSRGEEGISLEPDEAVEIVDGPQKADSNDKSLSVARPAASPAAATKEEGSPSGSRDETASVPAQPNALSVTSAPAGVENDPKVSND